MAASILAILILIFVGYTLGVIQTKILLIGFPLFGIIAALSMAISSGILFSHKPSNNYYKRK